MPTAWQTFPVELRGGLVTNLSPVQQGINMPGSARVLRNFEPSIEGGYRRIKGYEKFDATTVPSYGTPVVQGSGQSGTSLSVADLSEEPTTNDSFTVDGVTGTYTISAVSYDNSTMTATITLNETLASSPADKAEITFNNNSNKISGLIYFKQSAIAVRDSVVYKSSGSGWTKISTPSYGAVLVNGGSQSGSTLVVDGLTGNPKAGDTFSIAGVEKVYTVTSNATVTSGGASLSISPALASSPADNAVITFRTSNRVGSGKHRFTRYRYTGTETIVGVDGANAPFKYDETNFHVFENAPTEVNTPNHVAEFKNHLFFSKGSNLVFTAPYDEDEFDVALGAGSIVVPHGITGLIVFREQLIIFSRSKIYRLLGNTVSDFQLQPISLDIGCIHEDTIQEVGGDIAFLALDGVRLLSATDRIGDFGLAVASRPIQSETRGFVSSNTDFSSCVLRGKNQYRLFGYNDSITTDSAQGILGVQFADQTAEGMAWAELRGIRAYVVDSVYSTLDATEVAIFAEADGYVYSMEAGNSFDGGNILAVFSTPFLSFTDPLVRKTLYKLTTYVAPTGSVDGTATVKLDFDQVDVIQPASVSFSNEGTEIAEYGASEYGSASYAGQLRAIFSNQIVGSGFTASLQYVFDNTNPAFSLDTLAIEFMQNDRQ